MRFSLRCTLHSSNLYKIPFSTHYGHARDGATRHQIISGIAHDRCEQSRRQSPESPVFTSALPLVALRNSKVFCSFRLLALVLSIHGRYVDAHASQDLLPRLLLLDGLASLGQLEEPLLPA